MLVLDADHTGLQRLLGRGVGEDRNRHIGVPRLGGVTRCLHLFERVLCHVERIEGRGHSAAGHRLELRRPRTMRLAYALKHLRHTVGDHHVADLLHVGQRRVALGCNRSSGAESAVPRRLPDHRSREKYSRTDISADIGQGLQKKDVATHVAHCSKATQAPLCCPSRRSGRDTRDGWSGPGERECSRRRSVSVGRSGPGSWCVRQHQ